MHFAKVKALFNLPVLRDWHLAVYQDDDHPELSAAIKLKIKDILSSEDEATSAAAVRDVERSALQVQEH